MGKDYSQYGIIGKPKGRTVKDAVEFTAEEVVLCTEARSCVVEMDKETVSVDRCVFPIGALEKGERDIELDVIRGNNYRPVS